MPGVVRGLDARLKAQLGLDQPLSIDDLFYQSHLDSNEEALYGDGIAENPVYAHDQYNLEDVTMADAAAEMPADEPRDEGLSVEEVKAHLKARAKERAARTGSFQQKVRLQNKAGSEEY